jgi:hypothetical protein
MSTAGPQDPPMNGESDPIDIYAAAMAVLRQPA